MWLNHLTCLKLGSSDICASLSPISLEKGWKEPWTKDSWVPEDFGLAVQFPYQSGPATGQSPSLASCKLGSKKTGREPEAGARVGAERRKKGEG